MRRLVALTAMATVVVLAACSYVDRPTHVYRPSGIAAQASPASGEQLFLRDCAWCHGADGRGHEDDPSIVTEAGGPADVDFVLSTGRMPLRGEDQRMVRGTPAYTRKEIDAIVDYVRTLQPEGPEIPIVDLTIADRGRGEELYQENCAACHA
ncbi:MAG TPA: c-type cytochrome, partial [Actinomycetota bacterium]|nr:c-type cytochrome [Actinomycetota bacterium]